MAKRPISRRSSIGLHELSTITKRSTRAQDDEILDKFILSSRIQKTPQPKDTGVQANTRKATSTIRTLLQQSRGVGSVYRKQKTCGRRASGEYWLWL